MENKAHIALFAVIDALDRYLPPEQKSEVAPHVDVLGELARQHTERNEKYADDHLPQATKLELRMKAIELGVALANAKNKPSHAVYIAADMYRFIVTGERPPQPPAREKPEKESA